MKKISTALAGLAVALPALLASSPAAAQAYVEAMGKRTCDCIGKIDQGSGNLRGEKLKMQLGLCMLQSITPDDVPKLKRDYNFTPAKMAEAEGAQFGRVLGMQMATQCPQMLMRAAEDMEGDKQAISEGSGQGVVQRVETTGVVTITLRESNGSTQRYTWLFPASGNADLPGSYANLVGQSLRVRYEARELFDPRIGEFRKVRVITQADRVNEAAQQPGVKTP